MGRMLERPFGDFYTIKRDYPDPAECLWIVAANLKEARLRKGLTQEEAAKKVGISASQLSRYEGHETEPTFTSIVRLCNLYEVPPAHVMGFVGEAEQFLEPSEYEYALITAIRSAGLSDWELDELLERYADRAAPKRATRNVKHKGTHQKPNLPPK